MLDYGLVHYVFDKIIQKYYKIKRSAKLAQKADKRADGEEGSLSENEGSEEEKEFGDEQEQFESSKDIVDIEEIQKHADQYFRQTNYKNQSTSIQQDQSTTYNKLNVLDVIKRMEFDDSDSDSIEQISRP